VNEGDEVLVKVVKIEGPNRIRLSLKEMTDEEKAKAAEELIGAGA
jgi:polyribonucleotide nucleotidyltransferase